jgi:hypothetical protein
MLAKSAILLKPVTREQQSAPIAPICGPSAIEACCIWSANRPSKGGFGIFGSAAFGNSVNGLALSAGGGTGVTRLLAAGSRRVRCVAVSPARAQTPASLAPTIVNSDFSAVAALAGLGSSFLERATGAPSSQLATIPLKRSPACRHQPANSSGRGDRALLDRGPIDHRFFRIRQIRRQFRTELQFCHRQPMARRE